MSLLEIVSEDSQRKWNTQMEIFFKTLIPDLLGGIGFGLKFQILLSKKLPFTFVKACSGLKVF